MQHPWQRTKYRVELPDSFPPTDFVHVPRADRRCIKCDCVPRIPLKSGCCDQLYCSTCAVKNKRCTKHKQVTEYTIHEETKRQLSKLVRKCPNNSFGCEWKGSGWKLSRHLSEECPKTSMQTIMTVCTCPIYPVGIEKQILPVICQSEGLSTFCSVTIAMP